MFYYKKLLFDGFGLLNLEFKNNQYLYTYQYKDHLGNVRLTYRDGYKNHATQENVKDGIIQVTEIIDQTDYYPFGLKHNNNALADYSAVNKYKYAYNGKELNDELGVDLYDFGARNYDPALGRWLNVDPLAENSRRWTPYNYTYNSPLNYIDPDGRMSVSLTGQAAVDFARQLQGMLTGDDWFDEEDEKKAQRIESDLDKKISSLEGTKDIERIQELNKSKADIVDMRNDTKNQYTFKKTSSNNGVTQTKRNSSGIIELFADDMTNIIHENRHGGQIARNEFDIDTNGYISKGIFGVSKEIDAYRAQFAYDGKIKYFHAIDTNNKNSLLQLYSKGVNSFQKTLLNMKAIDIYFIQNLVDNPGVNQQYIYPRPSTNPDYYNN